MTQISMSVQQTMEDVMLMPAALTMTAASHVPVYLDIAAMESSVEVSHLTFSFTYIVFVTLADDDNKHKPWITSAILRLICTTDNFLYKSWLNS